MDEAAKAAGAAGAGAAAGYGVVAATGVTAAGLVVQKSPEELICEQSHSETRVRQE